MMLISYTINVQCLSKKTTFKISTIFALTHTTYNNSNNILCEMIIKASTIELKEVKAKYKYNTCVDFHCIF